MKRYKSKYSDDTVFAVNISESPDALLNFIKANGHNPADVIGGNTESRLSWIWRDKSSNDVSKQDLIGGARNIFIYDGNEYTCTTLQRFNEWYDECDDKGNIIKKKVKKTPFQSVSWDKKKQKLVTEYVTKKPNRRQAIVDLIARDTWSMDKQETPYEASKKHIGEPKKFHYAKKTKA